MEREIRHEDYLRVLKAQKSQTNKFVKLQSREHVMYTLSVCKTSLSVFDNKRFWLNDNQTSLPLGHFEIGKYMPPRHRQTSITDYFGICSQSTAATGPAIIESGTSSSDDNSNSSDDDGSSCSDGSNADAVSKKKRKIRTEQLAKMVATRACTGRAYTSSPVLLLLLLLLFGRR